MGMGFHATAFLSRCFPPPPQNCRSPGVRGLLPPKPPGSLPPAQPLVLCQANRVCIKQHEPSWGSGSLR